MFIFIYKYNHVILNNENHRFAVSNIQQFNIIILQNTQTGPE